MKKILSLSSAMVMLLTLLPVFTGCQEEPAKINITMVSDYSQLIDAINNTSRSLSDKLSLVESALASGFADSKTAQQMLQQAVASLTGTAAEKLAAIEEAVKSQTASLEMKLGLIEAAVTQGFADSAAQQALLQQAIESLSGTSAEKLALIEGAMKSQTASLETKLGLIETAIKEGLADAKAGQDLLQQAVAALTGTSAERLQAIESAMKNQTASLETKLDLIEAAIENRLADLNEALALLQQAIETLSGTTEEKLSAVEEAIQGQTASLEAKLALIEAAVAGGFADKAAKDALLQQALESLGGTMESKLAAITAAIHSQASTLSAKLALIETAITTGLADEQAGQKLIEEAIGTLDGTLKEKLAAIKQAIADQTTSLASKIDLIDQAVQDSLASSQAAQALLQQAFAALDSTTSARLDTLSAVMNRQTTALWAKLELIELAVRDSLLNTQGAIGQIETAIASLSTALASTDPNTTSVLNSLNALKTRLDTDIATALANIFSAINGLTNYSDILAAIQNTLEELLPLKNNGHAYVDLGMRDANGKSVFWATCNVGAENPEDYGDYFAWGDTEPNYQSIADDGTVTWKTGKVGFFWESYRWVEDGQDRWKRITKYTFADNDKDGTWWYEGDTFKGDNRDGVEHRDFASYNYEHDAARANWKGNWRTPTDAEWTWLRDDKNCKWEWQVDYNGAKGMLVTSNINGKVIFLPAAGYWLTDNLHATGFWGNYWSSCLGEEVLYARILYIYSGGEHGNHGMSSNRRCLGYSVRPVINK